MEDFGSDLLKRFEKLKIRFQKKRIARTECEELCREVSSLLPDLLKWEQFHLGNQLKQIFIWIFLLNTVRGHSNNT
jgi:hypothetical protein